MLEHTLLRAASASLAVSDTAQASQALHTAALLNPGHWPLAARLATLLGDTANAVDAYAQYLTRFPGDPVRIEALAELFLSLRSMEGIQQCRALVTFCAPDQQAALNQTLDRLEKALGAPAK